MDHDFFAWVAGANSPPRRRKTIGDLISHQSDGNCSTAIVAKVGIAGASIQLRA
jgi:hypothetical protein